jgi:hypothetical protein
MITDMNSAQVKIAATRAVMARFNFTKVADIGDIAKSVARKSFIAGNSPADFLHRYAVLSAAKRGLLEGAVLGGIAGYATAPEDQAFQHTVGGALAGAGAGGLVRGGLGYMKGQNLLKHLASDPAALAQASEMRDRYLALRQFGSALADMA